MTPKKPFEVTEFYQNLWDSLFKKQNKNKCLVQTKFYPYTTLKNTVRRRGTKIHLRISDLMKEAPEDVMRALGIILFCKLEKHPIPKREERLYRDYANSKKMQELLRKARKQRGRKVLTGPKGNFYHLEDSFNRINKRYFHNGLGKPRLTWSKRKTKTRFGHHDEALGTIMISRTLDNKNLPSYLLDYIMYHEALHIIHPSQYKNGRRILHSKEFRKDEKKFAEYGEARQLLKKISGRSNIRE